MEFNNDATKFDRERQYLKKSIVRWYEVSKSVLILLLGHFKYT